MNWGTGMSDRWFEKQYLLVWIFNVGRGICAFVRTPAKDSILIDCGGDDETKIIPSLRKHIFPVCRSYPTDHKVAQVIVSHPHVDHFSQIHQAKELNPMLWTCPHDKDPSLLAADERVDWDLIENPEGSEKLVEEYRMAYEGRKLPLQVFRPTNAIPYFSYGIFYIRPPDCEPIESQIWNEDNGLTQRDYGNNISVMVYFRFNRNSIFFPGDMMPSGMKRALETGCENRLVGEGIPEQFATQSSRAGTLRE